MSGGKSVSIRAGLSANSLFKSALLPRANDGTQVDVQYNTGANLVAAQGFGVDRKRHALIINGTPPNLSLVLSEDDDVYLTISTRMEQFPIAMPGFGIARVPLVTCTYQTDQKRLTYEMIPVSTGACPVAALREAPSSAGPESWEVTAAIRGTYDARTFSFLGFSGVDLAHLPTLQDLFTATASTPVKGDFSPDGNFGAELARASYFAPVVTTFRYLEPRDIDNIFLQMLIWCCGAALATVPLYFTPVGMAALPVTIASSVFACIGGAIAGMLSTLVSYGYSFGGWGIPGGGDGGGLNATSLGAQGPGGGAQGETPFDPKKTKKTP